MSVQIHCQLNTSGAASVQCEQQLRLADEQYLETWQSLGNYNTTPNGIAAECNLFANHQLTSMIFNIGPIW